MLVYQRVCIEYSWISIPPRTGIIGFDIHSRSDKPHGTNEVTKRLDLRFQVLATLRY
jgi:hypothetical protein